MTDIEQQIAKQVIADLLAADFSLSVHDGEETVIRNSRDPDAVFSVLGAVDEERIIATREGQRHGWVFLVYGNSGPDVVADYTTNLEPCLARTLALADSLDV